MKRNTITKSLALIAMASMMLPVAAQQVETGPISWSGELSTEAQENLKDGNANVTSLLYLDAKAPLWKGATAYGGIMATYNLRLDQGKSWSVIPDRQWFSNMPIDFQLPITLSKLGIEQQITPTFKMFFGVRKTDCDYFITPYSLLFLNTSVIVNPTISCRWNLPNYITAALCLHAEWDFLPGFALKSSLYNGQSSTSWDRMFYFRPSRDGIMNVTEVSYTAPEDETSLLGEYHLGTVYGNTYYKDYSDGKKHSNAVLFASVNQPVLRGRYPIGVLAQGSIGKKLVTASNKFYCLGALAGNLLKDGSKLGANLSRAYYSDGDHESDLEFTYSYPVFKGLAVQPGIHFIDHAGEHFTGALLRATLTF